MNKVFSWFRRCYRRVITAVGCTLFLVLLTWLGTTSRTAALIICVVVWLGHVWLGVIAVVAASRLWGSRHHPLLKWLWLYLNAFIIDVLSAIVMLFVARGVKFTWTFTAVMFISTVLSDIARAPLLFSLIRGRAAAPALKEPESSGELPPQFWLDAFRKIVKEEVAAELGRLRLAPKE